jgi:hypothetical protein
MTSRHAAALRQSAAECQSQEYGEREGSARRVRRDSRISTQEFRRWVVSDGVKHGHCGGELVDGGEGDEGEMYGAFKTANFSSAMEILADVTVSVCAGDLRS